MPLAPIPNPVAADATGLADSNWLVDVRDALQDYPQYDIDTWTADGTNGVVGANAVPLKTSLRPIFDTYDSTGALTGTLTVKNNTTSVVYTFVTTGVPTGNQIRPNFDTGELRFGTAPANNDAIQINYQFVKWRDASILRVLYDGLHAMFPRVGKTTTDVSIQIAVNTWSYTLPVWCQDPRSKVYSVEVKDPYITVEPWRPIRGGWTRTDLTTLTLPFAQNYSPAAKLKIVGWGPYLQLGDLEPQLYHLPILYALGTLLPKKEQFRLRQDTMVPLTQEGGQAPMLMTQSGDHFMRQFNEELNALGRVVGPGAGRRVRTVYQADARR